MEGKPLGCSATDWTMLGGSESIYMVPQKNTQAWFGGRRGWAHSGDILGSSQILSYMPGAI